MSAALSEGSTPPPITHRRRESWAGLQGLGLEGIRRVDESGKDSRADDWAKQRIQHERARGRGAADLGDGSLAQAAVGVERIPAVSRRPEGARRRAGNFSSTRARRLARRLSFAAGMSDQSPENARDPDLVR